MAWQKVCHCLSSSCSQKDSRGGQGGQTGQEILRDCSVTKSGARENSWRSQGGDVLWVWCHVPFPLCFVASCGRCEQRDFSRSQDIWYLRWTGIAQVFKQYSSNQAMCHLTITGILCVHQPQFTAGGISWWYTRALANRFPNWFRNSPRLPRPKSTPSWTWRLECKPI